MEEKKITMTDEEFARYEAWKADEEKRAAEAKAKAERKSYGEMIDDTIELAFPILMDISGTLTERKKQLMEQFKTAMQMKADIFGVKAGQSSHSFTNSEGNKRITVGYYVRDAYRDTVNEGIAIVHEYINSLAKDKETQLLVGAILRLLSRDATGNLNARRILELRKMADESGNERFVEGVKIIEESFQPSRTKDYIRAEYRDENGVWRPIPLSMTDC